MNSPSLILTNLTSFKHRMFWSTFVLVTLKIVVAIMYDGTNAMNWLRKGPCLI